MSSTDAVREKDGTPGITEAQTGTVETTKAHWHTGDNKVTSVPTYYVLSSEQLCFENTLTTLITLKSVYMVHFTSEQWLTV